jgi:hypothetical protein
MIDIDYLQSYFEKLKEHKIVDNFGGGNFFDNYMKVVIKIKNNNYITYIDMGIDNRYFMNILKDKIREMRESNDKK